MTTLLALAAIVIALKSLQISNATRARLESISTPQPHQDMVEPPAVAPAPQAPATSPYPLVRDLEAQASSISPPESADQPKKSALDLTSQQILAVIGGVLVLIAAIFFLSIAIGNGWITPTMQVILVYIGGIALCAVGVRQHDIEVRRGSDGQVPLIIFGTGIGVVQLANIVGTQIHDIVLPVAGLILALAAGGAAVAVAVRWNSQLLAAIGIVTGLLAPALVDAPATTGTLLLLTVALVCAGAICVLRNWPWLVTASLIITAPQVATWLDTFTLDYRTGTFAATTSQAFESGAAFIALAVVVAWWLIIAVASSGWQIRSGEGKLLTSGVLTMFTASAVATGLATSAISQLYGSDSHQASWLIAFAALHIAGGFIIGRASSAARAYAILIAIIGSGLLAGGVAVQLDGPAFTIFVAVEAVALLWVRYQLRDERAGIAAAAYGLIAVLSVLSFNAPLSALLDGLTDISGAIFGLLSLAGAGAAAAIIARSADEPDRPTRDVFILGAGIAILSLYYLASLLIVELFSPDVTTYQAIDGQTNSGQLALSVFWAATGLTTLIVGLSRNVMLVRRTGIVLLSIAAVKVLAIDTAELDNLRRVASLLGVGIAFIIGALAYGRIKNDIANE